MVGAGPPPCAPCPRVPKNPAPPNGSQERKRLDPRNADPCNNPHRRPAGSRRRLPVIPR